MTSFWIALQFLTIIPVQLKAFPTPRQNAYSLVFYPFVGLLIGLILFLLASGLQLIHVPVLLSSALILTVWVIITGGLHLDGLADTADAWVGGYGDRERTLKIMKDPQCGPVGVLSLVLTLILKFSALNVVLQTQQLMWLMLIPILGRLAILFLFLTCDYVRKKGLGTSFLDELPSAALWGMCLFCLVPMAALKMVGLTLTFIYCAGLCYLRYLFVQRLDGITGDTIGAAVEISECLSLFTLAILLSTKLF